MPVIASNHSAHLEFLKKDGQPLPGVLLLDGKVEPYDKGDSMYYPGFNWFNPSVEDLRKKMRFAFENFKKLKEEALKSSEYIRKEWCWAKTQEAVIRRIEEVYKTRWGRYGDRFEKD
jgi:hypothetical protein